MPALATTAKKKSAKGHQPRRSDEEAKVGTSNPRSRRVY
jgi:hypothetical protein